MSFYPRLLLISCEIITLILTQELVSADLPRTPHLASSVLSTAPPERRRSVPALMLPPRLRTGHLFPRHDDGGFSVCWAVLSGPWLAMVKSPYLREREIAAAAGCSGRRVSTN